MPVKKFTPQTPLTRIAAKKIVIDSKEKRPAVFFELDGFVRFFRPDVFDRYKAEAETKKQRPPAGPMKRHEQVLHPEAVAFLKAKQEEGYLLIGLTMQEHVEWIAHAQGLKQGAIALENMLDVQAETFDLLNSHGVYVTEIAHCPHYMDLKPIYGPHPTDPKKQIVVDEKRLVRCPCHFPKRGLIETTTQKHNIDLFNSIIVWVNDSARIAAMEMPGHTLIAPWDHRYIIDGIWRQPKATELEVKVAEALKKDIKAGSSGQMGAIANNEFGKTEAEKALEEAMPNYTRVLHEEGLLEEKE